MYLSLKEKKTPKEHKIFLLLSILVVTSSLYTLLDANRNVMLSCVTQPKVKEKVLALVINQTSVKKVVKQPVVTKEVIKQRVVKKEIVKEEVIKEEIVKETVEEIVEKEIVQTEVETKQEIVQEVEQEVEQEVKPIFDEKTKESFIAGLYEILNKNNRYPEMAKRRKIEGVCEVSFTLNKDGSIKDVFLKEECGHSILDKAALKVVSSIKFYKPIPNSVSLTSLRLNIPIKYTRK